MEEARRALSTTILKSADSLQVAYDNALRAEKGMDETVHEAEVTALRLSQKAIHYNLLGARGGFRAGACLTTY